MKNKFENAIILIGAIIFIVCLTIMSLYLIPVICEVSIDRRWIYSHFTDSGMCYSFQGNHTIYFF